MANLPGDDLIADDYSTAITDLQDATENLDARVGLLEDGYPICRLSRSVPLLLPNVTGTPVPFDDEEYDFGPFHSGSEDEAIIPLGGIYMITVWGTFEADSAGERILQLLVNGTPVSVDDRRDAQASGRTSLSFVYKNYLNVGDAVQLSAYQDSGGDLNLDGVWIEIQWMRNLPA